MRISKNKNTKRLVILDAHAILHRSYHGMPDFTTKDGRPSGALYGYISMIARLCDDLNPDYLVAAYDLPKPTFRHIAYDNYKGHRAKSDDNLIVQINESYKVCEALNIPIYSLEGFEADDMIGTIVEIEKENSNLEIIIASGDMDTMQLIDKEGKVKVYTLKKANEMNLYDWKAVIDKYGFPPEHIADFKALAGDSSDNITGVSGIGAVTATKLVAKYGTVENLYKELNQNNVPELKERQKTLLLEGVDDAEFSKVLATIRRDAPIHFEVADKEWHIDRLKYVELCEDYNFKSLITKFGDKSVNKSLDSNSISNIKVNNKANYDGEGNIILPKVIVNLENYNEEAKNTASSIGDSANNISELDTKEELNNLATEENKILMNLINSEATNPDSQTIYDYTSANNTAEANKILLERVTEKGLLDYYNNIELPLIKILQDMKSMGITTDKGILLEQSERLHKIVKALEEDIYRLAGHEFNINSPKQLGVVLYDELFLGNKIKKTSTGQKSTGIEMLEKMKDDHEIVAKIMRYRELSKLLNTYIDSLPNYIEADGRIHATLVQTGAATGRFSSIDPNLQNLPAKIGDGVEVRKAFVAGKGKKFISLDYSQIDLRSAAMLSGDESLINIFRNGIDVHSGVAAIVYGKSEAEISSDERRHAKAINFGILYGMGVTALKDSMGVDRKTAQEFYDAYKVRFSTLMEYLEDTKEFARTHGYVETLFKRQRQVPLIKSQIPFMRAQGERIAINAPIQGTSADILKIGMIDVYEHLQKNNSKAKIILQIHDELVLETDTNDNGTASEVKAILENVLSKRGKSIVPLVVGVKEGQSLYDLK